VTSQTIWLDVAHLRKRVDDSLDWGAKTVATLSGPPRTALNPIPSFGCRFNQTIDLTKTAWYLAKMVEGSKIDALLDAPDTTREALVRVALERFGTNGFEATSTREISKAAGANIAAIAYHFGGKEGLRRACAEYVAALIGQKLGPALGGVDADLPLGPSGALARLSRAFEAMIDFVVVNPEAEPIARFMLREMTHPSPAFDLIHEGALAPMHEALCILWARATGDDPKSEVTRLSTLATFAQALYFRIARRVVLRRMGWRDIGPQQASAIKRVLLRNLKAATEAARRAPP
jgi:AcrR family transcriptional regulator